MVAASPSIFPDFDNLLNHPSGDQSAIKATRRIFVHELTHAWQYQHKRTLSRLCDIIGTRLDEVLYGQNAVYHYTPGLSWDDYNMEQQANIVGDWYSVKFNNFWTDTASTKSDTENERYIHENILMGKA